MEKEQSSQLKIRLSLLFGIVFIALATLILRLSYVQLVEGEQLRKQAEGNRFAEKVIPAPRGWIMDRDKQVLVDNKPSFTVMYTLPVEKSEAYNNKQVQSITQKLLPVINKDTNLKEKVTEKSLFEILMGSNPKLPASVPRKVIVDAKVDQVAFIKEHQDELPGVTIQAEPIRDYKDKTLASHILGYMRSIDEKSWPPYAGKGYQPTDKVGWTGLEYQYESYLHGKDGVNKVEVNINGEPVKQFERIPPVKGDDLILNIDQNLQKVTETALEERVKALGVKPGSRVKHAAAVAMDPNTGEVLAMASYPPYDPNDFVKGLSPEQYQNFLLAQTNYATAYPLAPGSPVKPLSVLIGLKEGVITKDEKIYCPGFKNIGDYRANDWLPGGHGAINGAEAIAESCDVYMYTLGMRLAHFNDLYTVYPLNVWSEKDDKPAFDQYMAYAKEFGLGTSTGIDIYEKEGAANYAEQTLTNMPFSAMGQSEAFTPIQLVQYISTIINGGKRMEPHLANRIVDPTGKVIKEFQPKVLNTVPFTQDQLEYVKTGMRMTTSVPSGTAYSLFHESKYNPAAKTGTAESGTGTEHSWFTAYAPYDHPKIAIAVVIPDTTAGGHSYELAGVITKAMLDSYFPDDKEKK